MQSRDWTRIDAHHATRQQQHSVQSADLFIIALNLFSTYQLLGPVFVQAEYEPLSFEKYARNSLGEIVGEQRAWVHNVFLGGGITQSMGRGAVFISVLYNVTWSNSFDSYYSSPWVFRIGFGI